MSALVEKLRERIRYLERRLETAPGWSEDADGIACRNDTIALQDERIKRQAARIAELEGALALVEGAMLRGGDGKIMDMGWNITLLNRARPTIHAALNKAAGDE